MLIFNLQQGIQMDFLSDEHRQTVGLLNNVIIQSGNLMEGNLYYAHHQNLALSQTVIPQFAKKRAQIAALARVKSRVLEIGFNAGHSAALMLHANPTLTYFGIDICQHAYTEPCMHVMSARFPGRVSFFAGDSGLAYPYEFERYRACDLIHIDGGHSQEMFRIDMTHALTLPRDESVDRHILIDDTEDPDNPAISPELNRWIQEGWVEVVDLGGIMQTHGNHLLVRQLRRN
ncbi:MAG: class I SAM-dependent methyltransferase [Verrucomicrobiaceae bacterium]|nr:MAG: class I SAM-dependent methyltransferase [Verrucomicrobiaceae bacterium]